MEVDLINCWQLSWKLQEFIEFIETPRGDFHRSGVKCRTLIHQRWNVIYR